jgi:L-ornithine N5-oxygenase
MHIHDLIGIGFGPSNIALAIALEEGAPQRAADAFFIEKQPGFAWHRHMLLKQSHMQISFLKDLATLRNPTSRFTFVNYLHQKGRLQDFINLKTFFPSRHEFSDYLGWAAAQFEHRCAYGEEVFEVLPERWGSEVALLRVRSRDAHGGVRERVARNLIVSVGGTPRVPDGFKALRGDARVFHSSTYLESIARFEGAPRVAVVGAGQSAAEIFMDLNDRPGAAQVDLVMRARSIHPSDDSPFVNEIFNTGFTDFVFNRSKGDREALLEEFWHTNYAAPDLALIEKIFDVFYQQSVTGEQRHRFLRRHRVEGVEASPKGIELTLRDLNTEQVRRATYDAVVLATGYSRQQHKTLLAPLAPYLEQDFDVDRQYRLRSRPGFHPAIFLQGACEASHGLSDTLLSVTAVRSDEIRQALPANAAPTQPPSAAAGQRQRDMVSI